MVDQKTAGTPATLALTAARIPFTVHEYDHDAANTDFGREAVQSLGLDPWQMFKTLIVDTGAARANLACGIVPVAAMMDLKAMARELGVKKVDLADPHAAELSSGYIVGGISPVGQKNQLPTILDEMAGLFDTIFVSGGRRGMDIELRPDDLLRVVNGRFANIIR